MEKYCLHDDCKADAIQSLRWLADVLRWTRDLLSRYETIVMRGQVPCRHVENPGRIPGNSPRAPFPGAQS